MNNNERIQAMVGQHWRNRSTRERRIIDAINQRGSITWRDGSDTTFASKLNKHWEFVPRNDLEWLALNLSTWANDSCRLAGVIEYTVKYSNSFELLAGVNYWYEKQEWLDMQSLLFKDKDKYILRSGKWEKIEK